MLKTTVIITTALTVAGGSWYVAVDLTTGSDLTAIYNCSAFFAYAFSIPLLGDKFRIDKAFSVLVAIIGVVIVAYGPGGDPAGVPDKAAVDKASNRALGNVIIGVGSILYGLYEVLYKRLACPPEGTSPGRGVIFANTVGSLIGCFTLLVLWIPLPFLHWIGWEKFEWPQGEAAYLLLISTLSNASMWNSAHIERLRSIILTDCSFLRLVPRSHLPHIPRFVVGCRPPNDLHRRPRRLEV
jgi:drug/metabolite transporter (DMT)-like permease